MSELLIRNLDDDLLSRIQRNAEVHGWTVEEEVKTILERAAPIRRSKEEAIARLRALREKNAHLQTSDNRSEKSVLERARAIRKRYAHLQKTNTLDLLREDRDNR